MTQQQPTILPMSIEDFNSNTSSLLQTTYQLLLKNEQSINELLSYIDSSIEKEQQKIAQLDENIEKFEGLITNLTTNFQNLFNN